MDKKIGHTPKDTAINNLHLNNTSASAQRQRLKAALIEFGSVTTFFARDVLGIMAPAARCMELKDSGLEIYTERISLMDRLGVIHHGVARYVLMAQSVQGGEV